MPAQDQSPQHDRVAKVLARAGVASRREVERLIAAGRVALNGRVLTTPAVKVEPGDILTVDGEVVASAEPTRVFRYHKPVGLVTTHSDPKGRPTVFQALPEGLPRVISVGRLDLNSEGLLLLTNDGGLSRALELPSTGWTRVYRARAFGSATQPALDALKDGVTVEGVRYGPIEARLDKAQGRNVWLTVTLAEGKNREVRRVLESLGLKVNRLIRLSYGPFALGDLGPGQVEEVGPRVIRELLAGHVDEANMPRGNAVQFKGGGGVSRRPAAPAEPAAPKKAVRPRPGQETGERKGPPQPKKPGWARAKPRGRRK
ncbi:MAG: pseudouridine synthase [Pseudomonadota bacterium]